MRRKKAQAVRAVQDQLSIRRLRGSVDWGGSLEESRLGASRRLKISQRIGQSLS